MKGRKRVRDGGRGRMTSILAAILLSGERLFRLVQNIKAGLFFLMVFYLSLI